VNGNTTALSCGGGVCDTDVQSNGGERDESKRDMLADAKGECKRRAQRKKPLQGLHVNHKKKKGGGRGAFLGGVKVKKSTHKEQARTGKNQTRPVQLKQKGPL